MSVGQEQDVNDLMNARADLIQERDKLLNDVTQLRFDLDSNFARQTELEKRIQESNEQILGLQEKINQMKNENTKESKKRVCFVILIIIFIIKFIFLLGTN